MTLRTTANSLKPIEATTAVDNIVDELVAAELQMDPGTDPEMCLRVHAASEMAQALQRANSN